MAKGRKAEKTKKILGANGEGIPVEPRRIVTSTVATDRFTKLVEQWFDIPVNGTSTFECWSKPIVSDFSLGLIIGPSGTGKSLLLKEFEEEEELSWDQNKAVVSQYSEDSLEAVNRLMAVGFNDVRSFVRPYHVLSTGEQFRASLARRLKDGAVIDEFTSVVDRNVAKAASVAMKRYITKARIEEHCAGDVPSRHLGMGATRLVRRYNGRNSARWEVTATNHQSRNESILASATSGPCLPPSLSKSYASVGG